MQNAEHDQFLYVAYYFNIIVTHTLKITAAKIYQGCHLKTVVQPMEVVAVYSVTSCRIELFVQNIVWPLASRRS